MFTLKSNPEGFQNPQGFALKNITKIFSIIMLPLRGFECGGNDFFYNNFNPCGFLNEVETIFSIIMPPLRGSECVGNDFFL